MRFSFGNFSNFGNFNQDPNTGEYSWTPQRGSDDKPKKPRRTFSRGASLLISLAVTLVFGFFYFYFQLPAINIHSGDFYVFIILLCAVYCVCAAAARRASAPRAVKGYVSTARKKAAIPFYIVCLCIAVAIVGSGHRLEACSARGPIPSSCSDRGRRLRRRRGGDLLRPDPHAGLRLGQRSRQPPAWASSADLVSQFEVNAESYPDQLSRTAPCASPTSTTATSSSGGTTRSAGIPAYMVIDMVTQEVDGAARLDEGITLLAQRSTSSATSTATCASSTPRRCSRT